MAQMPFIPFGPWTPDRSEFNTDGTEQALNVIRTANGYRSFSGLTSSGTAKLPDGKPTGLFSGKDNLGNAEQFAAIFTEPNTTGIYRLVEAGGEWDQVGSLVLTSDTRFRTVQFDERLYVTNLEDGLREYILGAGGEFEPVPYDDENGGSIGLVKPKFIATIRDILFGAFMDEPVGGLFPARARWSALGQPEVWSFDGNADNLSDFQDIPDAGECRGIVGGEYGTLLMEDGVIRVDFIGPPAIFSFNRIENARGCSEPNSIISEGQNTYYLSDDGWAKFDGQTVEAIGAERFDRWFGDESAISTRNNMTAHVDPQEQLLIWGFDSGEDPADINDTALIYNYVLSEPTYAKFSHSLLGSITSPGFSIDETVFLAISDPAGFQGSWNEDDTYLLSNPDSTPAGSPDRVTFDNTVWEALADSLDVEPVEGASWTEIPTAPDYRGLWSATGQFRDSDGVLQSYAIGDRVQFANLIYEALTTPVIGVEPPGGGWSLTNPAEISVSIDDLQTSFDGIAFKADASVFGALQQNIFQTFTGVPLLAQIDTSEQRLGGEKRAKVQMVQTAIEGIAQQITVQIGSRNRLGKPVVFGPERELTPDGQYAMLRDSRYQRVRVNITSTAQGGWSDATGVFVRSQVTSLR